MTPLGDLLELLHNADGLSTFQGEYRDWLRPSPDMRLVVDAEDAVSGRLRWRGPGPFPQASESLRRIWMAQPNRVRVELERKNELERVGVRDRDRWWRWDRGTGVTAGRLADRSAPPLLDQLLFSSSRLIGWLRFEPAGSAVRLGREVMLARARPRNPSRGVDFVLDFEFDSKHAVVLRRAVAKNGCCIRVTEALEVHFNRPIGPQRFVFEEPRVELRKNL